MNNTGEIIFWGFDHINVAKFSSEDINFYKKIADSKIKNIIGVDFVQNTLAILGINTETNQFAIFFFNTDQMQLEKISKVENVVNIGLSPDRKNIALLTYSSNSSVDACNIDLIDLTDNKIINLVNNRASRQTSLSWNSNCHQIAYHSRNGDIEILDINTLKINTLFKGEAPSWAPDGKKMAYRSGKKILIHDFEKEKTTQVYKRSFWQSDFHGFIYWSPQSDQILLNVFAGIDGKSNKTLIADLVSKKVHSIYTGFYFGGPFMKKTK